MIIFLRFKPRLSLMNRRMKTFHSQNGYSILLFELCIIVLFFLIKRWVYYSKRNITASYIKYDMAGRFQKLQVYAISTSNYMIGNAINDKFNKW